MATIAVLEDPSAQVAPLRWHLATRLIFRVAFVYFPLLCLCIQVLSGLINIPGIDIPDVSTLPPILPVVEWTARHVFHIRPALTVTGSGSGDKYFDWVLGFCLLVTALIATIVWSILDRRRTSYPALHKWFRVFLRFALGSQMLVYGFAKLFPMQMPYPSLQTLLEPYGHFSPMGVLWSFIGASPAYEQLCGSAEILAGILLLIPGPTLLGALLCAAISLQIFILNMTYDIPVKLFSFHLFLMSCFLIAPEASRLFHFMVLNRAVGPSRQPRLFGAPRANRLALWAQLVFAAWLIGSTFWGTWMSWPKWGGGRPKSPLYGIWNIQQVSIDNQVRSPLLNDYGRWRRLIFDYPDSMSYQRMDDSFGYCSAAIDPKTQVVTLNVADDKTWSATLHYSRIDSNRMNLDGSLGGHRTHFELRRENPNELPLVSRGFHWVQEYPFNR